MGKIQAFTKEQKIILDAVKQNDFIRSNFYFTGGTALSSFYLSHRYSDDLDFSYYPHKRLEKGKVIDNLEVDNLLDIAVNKILTVSSRTEVKDFVDLYFLLQKFHVWDLITGVKVKFNREIEPLLLGADFLKVEDFEFLPKMILPLTLKDLKAFFRQKAKEVGSKSVE